MSNIWDAAEYTDSFGKQVIQKEHCTIHFLTKWITNYDVLLTVRLSIILETNQLNAQILLL